MDAIIIGSLADVFIVGVVLVALGIWFLVSIIDALCSGIWRCPQCDFATRSEEEALGHTAKHNMHRPIL